jgi:lipid-binding SYLF domain-containing protein
MKKFVIALFCFAARLGGLRAADNSVFTRKNAIIELDSCEAIIREMQGNFKTAIPAEYLRKARGIIIINQFQGSFILGIKDGYGVAMVRRSNGKWSVPAFLKAGELSIGFQAGGRAINAVYLLMDDDTARLLFKNRMNLGAEANVAAGVRAAESEAVTKPLPNNTNVLVYSTTEGLFAGAAVKTGYITPHEAANELFYNSKNRMPELLYSDWVTPPAEAQYIMDYVAQITR